MPRDFVPDRLQLPSLSSKLRVATGVNDVYLATLHIYGGAIAKLFEVFQQEYVEKRIVKTIAEEVLGEAAKGYGQAVAMLYNDLRRLGVVTIGRGGNWYEEQARLTYIGRRVRSILQLRNDVEPETIAAIVIALCMQSSDTKDLLVDEAGVCIALSRGNLYDLDTQTMNVVKKALELIEQNCDLVVLALSYGSNPRSIYVFKKLL